jgi:hypothetical protein
MARVSALTIFIAQFFYMAAERPPSYILNMNRPTKITFGEMRASGVRNVVVYCADYRCSHSQTLSADRWPDDVRLSDIEGQFICSRCGKRGADVRPDFNWDKRPEGAMGYR